MAKYKFEYIWLDGYKPEPNLRSKTKVIEFDSYDGAVDALPIWAFDGSSTMQAEGRNSDLLLLPCAVYPDPERANAWLVMCEVLNPDETPHESNTRSLYSDDKDFWFGFEQEYVLVTPGSGRPVGFPEDGYPAPQGKYYCSVGTRNVTCREIVEQHLDVCLEAGLDITGINAEVLIGQWEFQCFAKGAKKAADDLWVARYLLARICEEYGVMLELKPKPVKGDWNGSGMHTNFSNKAMRDIGGKEMFNKIFTLMEKYHDDHISVYGSQNDERLTGLHETQHIGKFSHGVSDRGASIRIPITTVRNDWKGYLEDRRPASNADPYQIVAKILRTVKEAMVPTNGVHA
jgi:glutamine synthetase